MREELLSFFQEPQQIHMLQHKKLTIFLNNDINNQQYF